MPKERWIWEEYNRLSSREDTLDERDDLVRRPSQVFFSLGPLTLLLSQVLGIDPRNLHRRLISRQSLLHFCFGIEVFSLLDRVFVILKFCLLLFLQDRVPFLDFLQFSLLSPQILTFPSIRSLLIRAH